MIEMVRDWMERCVDYEVNELILETDQMCHGMRWLKLVVVV